MMARWILFLLLTGVILGLSASVTASARQENAWAVPLVLMDAGEFSAALDQYIALAADDPVPACVVAGLSEFLDGQVAWHTERAATYEDQEETELAAAERETALALDPSVATPAPLMTPKASASPYSAFATVSALDDHGFPTQTEAKLLELITATPASASDVPPDLRNLDQDRNNDYPPFKGSLERLELWDHFIDTSASLIVILAVVPILG